MSDKSIDSILTEKRVFPPSESFTAAARLKPADVEALYREEAERTTKRTGPASRARNSSGPSRSSRFSTTAKRRIIGGSRTVPSTYRTTVSTCTSPNAATRPRSSSRARAATNDVLTYRELTEKVCQFANALNAQGIDKGDRVVIYMPMVPEAVIAMQACARIGAIHSVVFGGFSANSLRDRIDRRRREDGHHRGWRASRRQDRRTEGRDRRGACRAAARPSRRSSC